MEHLLKTGSNEAICKGFDESITFCKLLSQKGKSVKKILFVVREKCFPIDMILDSLDDKDDRKAKCVVKIMKKCDSVYAFHKFDWIDIVEKNDILLRIVVKPDSINNNESSGMVIDMEKLETAAGC